MTETPTTRPQAEPEHPTAPREPTPFPVVWQRLALFGILLLAICMDFYRLGQDGFSSYYPPAVRSMMDNWHNFFFAAYDPGGFTSLDKPPLGFWFQVLSAKIFGLNTVSILLPQATFGVLSVLLLYWLVKCHFGVVAGLLSALALAISPVSVVTNRNATIDSTLTLCLLLGAWAVMRAAESGRLRWLLLSALIVGIGFNIKMLEAYLVVPAFGLLYLLAAPTSIQKRVLHLALALLVLLVVSFSWVLAVDLTPASQRPYVGNTQDDSELSLALGYNGIQRLLGLGAGPEPTQGKSPSSTGTPPPKKVPIGGKGGPTPSTNGSPGGRTVAGGPGIPDLLLGLFTEPLAGQSSWLLPLALLGLIALAWRRRPRFQSERKLRSLVHWGIWLLTLGIFFSTAGKDAGDEQTHPHPRSDRKVQSLILWGMCLLTMGIFFSVASVAGFIHEYYLTVMAPAIAALCGIGLVVMWQDYRAGGWRGWLLPLALLLTAAEQIVILTTYPTWGKFMIPLLLIPCLLAAGVLVSVRLAFRRTGKAKAVRVLLPALAVGLVALLLAPTIWAALPILQGTEMDIPLAGPEQQGGGLTVQGAQATVDPTLVRYLEKHQGHARVLVVTNINADALILATNRPVMPLNGFSSYPLTIPELASLVANGTVRFFLLGVEGSSSGSVTAWVTQHCATVPPSLWQSSSSSSQAPGDAGSGAAVLYDCASPH
jgi:4-amino-4-deoxy-L-arabinose transferase-like glycosyltransferase